MSSDSVWLNLSLPRVFLGIHMDIEVFHEVLAIEKTEEHSGQYLVGLLDESTDSRNNSCNLSSEEEIVNRHIISKT